MSSTMTQREEAAQLYIDTLKRLGASAEVIEAAEKVAARGVGDRPDTNLSVHGKGRFSLRRSGR